MHALEEIEPVLARIAKDYPELEFIESAHFSWHAGHKRVSYKKASINPLHDIFALLHELGHAILDHKDYSSDIELLQLEVKAWEKARVLARNYNVSLDEEYVQDCLDSYRDWLHLRATCPTCYGRALQSNISQYECFNCKSRWQVTKSRLCRPYRLQKP